MARRLIIDQDEAARVQTIFQLFLDSRDLTAVVSELRARGWTTKQWTSSSGRQYAGRPFTERSLARLLGNVLYTGSVNHRGEIYPGEHPPIIEAPVWREVNQLLPPKPLLTARRAGLHRRHGLRQGHSEPAAHSAAARVPRISRLMALAIRFEAMLKRGEVRTLADLARLGQVSPARITQVMNLLNLRPAIQERLLLLEPSDCASELRERNIRKLTQVCQFEEQERLFQAMITKLVPKQRMGLVPG